MSALMLESASQMATSAKNHLTLRIEGGKRKHFLRTCHLRMGQTQSLPLHPSEALFVVLVHFNPQGFQRRDDLFLQSISHLLSFAHVRLVSIELVHNGGAATTPKAAPSSTSLARWAHREVLRTDDVLWAKESLINRGVATARSL